MSDSQPFDPQFDKPPVIETRISVQFSPLVGFRSGHFGQFWQSCLGLEWQIQEDEPFVPTEVETFGSKYLRPPREDEAEEDQPRVCMKLTNEDGRRFVKFQTNRLTYGWKRESGARPSYTEVKAQFVDLYAELARFAREGGFDEPRPNLWDVTYVNTIPKGKLWQTPADWHRVLPALFPVGGPKVGGHEWTTFSGAWVFEIPPERGRLQVRVQKVVANQNEEVLILLVIGARGQVGGTGVATWSEGLDLGHASALRAFHDIASSDARREWGLQS